MKTNTNIELTIQAWSEIVIKNWLDKIEKLNIYSTFQLHDSFTHHIISNAGGDIARIEFAFNYYGKFIDMGVGKGVKIEDVTNTDNRRRPKKWYSKVLYSEFMKLKELLAEKYAKKGALAIIENIKDNSLRHNS